MVQYGIRQATETMQQMTSVERILQYTDLESVNFIYNNQIVFVMFYIFVVFL